MREDIPHYRSIPMYSLRVILLPQGEAQVYILD